MGLETATYISGLNASNPVNATDVVGEGDDHLRLIKSTLLNTFPNITGAMTRTHTQLNNAAIKDEDNVFTKTWGAGTGTPIKIQASLAYIEFEETDAALDEKIWLAGANASDFYIWTRNDANNAGETPIRIARTAESVDSIQLSTAATVRFDVLTAGQARIRSAGNTDAENRALLLSHQDGTLRASLGHEGGDTLLLRNNIHAGTVRITGEDTGGTTRVIFDGDPDGFVGLYSSGNLILQVNAGIIQLRSVGNTDSENRYIVYEHSDGSDRGRLGYVASDIFTIQNLIHGGEIRMQGETGAGVTARGFIFDPDGNFDLYYPNSDDIRMQMRPGGIVRVLSDDSTDTEDRRIDFTHANATLRGLVGYVSGDILRLDNRIHGGNIRLQGEDTGGTARIMLDGDPDDELLIYHPATSTVVMDTREYNAAGVTTGARVRDHGGSLRDIGLNLLIEFNDDVDDTLEAQHAGSLSSIQAATDRTLTLEANTAGDFPVGAVTHLVNGSAANDYNVNEGTGTTLYYVEPGGGLVDTTGGAVIGPGGIASLWRRSATDYWIWGSEITYTP